MEPRSAGFIGRLAACLIATLALVAGSLTTAETAVAEDGDVLWVDLNFFGVLSTTEPLSQNGGGTSIFYSDGRADAELVPLADFGETQLRVVSQQVDDYYNESTNGRIRFRFGSWSPFSPTSATECSTSRDVLPDRWPVPLVRRVTVVVHAAGCTPRSSGGWALLGQAFTVISGKVSAWVLAHEIGHNLGVRHANTQECQEDPIGDCTSHGFVEYGIDRGVMGTYRSGELLLDLARTRPLDPAQLFLLNVLDSVSEVRFDRPPQHAQLLRLNAYGSKNQDIITLVGADSSRVSLAYLSDPSLSDVIPVGVEVYRPQGSDSLRNGPAPLEVGEVYGGDLGYAVKVIRLTPEYAEIEVSDAGEPLTAPEDVTATAQGRSVHLTWNPPRGRITREVVIERRGRTEPDGYRELRPDEVTSWTGSSATVSSVGKYTYRVRLKTTQGFTPFSGESNEVTNADLPGAVTSAEVYPVNAGVVVRPQCTNGGAEITSHELRYTLDPSQPVDQWETGTASPEYGSSMKGLQNGQTYALQIACSNTVGTGPFSQTYEVTPTGLPQPPVIARYMVDKDPGNPGYVRLWVWLKAAEDSEPNSSRLRIWLDNEEYRACVRYRGNSDPCIINKLNAKQPYTVHLVTIDDEHAWGPQDTKIIKAIDPPTAPSNVRAQAGQGTAVLSWNASTAYTTEPITYEVRDEAESLLCTTTETQCSIALPDSDSWTVTITAFNDGVASPSTQFTGFVSTNPPPPNPPVSPPPTTQPPTTPPPPTDPPPPPPPTTPPPPTPYPPTGQPGNNLLPGSGSHTGTDGANNGGGLPTSGIPNDIVRLQTIRKPSRVARVNTTWKVPKRTRQGQRAKWTTGTPSVCKIAKGKRLRFRERGKCLVSVTAPSTVGLVEYSKTFKVRVKGRR